MHDNTRRVGVGILLFVLAANAHSLAIALDDVEQPSDLSVLPADSAMSFTELPDEGLDASCCPVTSDPCPCVYAQVEALFLMRDPRLRLQPLIVDPNTNVTFLSTSDLNFNLNPGVRATVGTRLCGSNFLEFSYFSLFSGGASAAAIAPDSGAFLILPGNLVGNVFIDLDQALINYSSWLNSFELNTLCCCGCCDDCCDECGCSQRSCQSVEWFAGFRYLNLGENFNIAVQRIVAGGVEDGAYNVRTSNNLYGVQLGARVRRMQGRFGWEAMGKAGVFGNDAQQVQSVTDFPDFALRPLIASRGGGVASIGEINLTGLYRLTDIWNLRAGYMAMWIEGLALAPDQLDFNFAAAQGGSNLYNGGGMLLHGVNIGLEARW